MKRANIEIRWTRVGKQEGVTGTWCDSDPRAQAQPAAAEPTSEEAEGSVSREGTADITAEVAADVAATRAMLEEIILQCA